MKKIGLVVLGIFLMVFMIVFLGNTPNEPYHPENSIKEDGDYLLSFIEFDDQGQLHNRQQLTNLLKRLKNEVEKDNLIIVAFVHGWHHSAEPTDDNLHNFKYRVLKKINTLEADNSKAENRPKRKIVGVYLGWRGDSISIDYLNYLTFWDRKNTAESIGRRGGVTEVLLELEQIRNTSNNKGVNRLITIGHSFGGLIVYSALSHIFMERFLSAPPNRIIDGIGDMVVLMNPAFEAIQFSNFHNVIQSKKGNEYCKWQPPLMAIFTSKSDMATKLAFPFGRFFSTMFDTHKPINQTSWKGYPLQIDEQKSNRTAIGHFEPFRNYEFEDNSKSTPEDHTENHSPWFTNNTEKLLNFSKTQLKRLGTSHYLNPYLVIQVDEKIIEDHNKIWDKESKILPFLQHLILLSTNNKFLASNDFHEKSQTCQSKETSKVSAAIAIEAKAWELEGFKQLLQRNVEDAIIKFQKSYKAWPTYHNVDEILRLLTKEQSKLKEDKLTNWCQLYQRILNKYVWGMPNEVKIKMQQYEGCSDVWEREAKAWELKGFKQLLQQNVEDAIKAFQKSYDVLPTHHNVDEISKLLTKEQSKLKEDKLTNWCQLYKRILNEYVWGMPNEVKTKMQQYEGCNETNNG